MAADRDGDLAPRRADRDGGGGPLLARLPRRLGAAVAAAVERPWPTAAGAVAIATLVAMCVVVVSPWLANLSTFGFHDWDVQTAHRELVRASLLRHHEMPWWNPYACGGFPAWGYVEADTIVVSPYLVAYLALPMSVALRVEVLGQALVGAFGAWAAASCFTKRQAPRTLVAALWAVNGRWGLQTASGHTWHLAYALLPWCLFFFERARVATRLRFVDLLGGAVSFALLVYWGGIYPLPHTIVALGVYATALSLLERSPRPLVVLAAMGLAGMGLAAPKMLPLIDGFSKVPRLIESKETLDVGALVTMLTSRDQAFYARPARVSPYGWHEWGMYIGAAGLAILTGAFVLVQGRREAALKATAALFVALGFGAFHPLAPWTLAHAYLPIFKSQHVPSRFLYPAVLLAGLVAAAGLGRLLDRRLVRWPWLDVAAGLAVLAIALDVATVARKPMADAMWMEPPAIPAGRAFHHEQEPPFQYKKRDWAGPMYLAMLGNSGVLNCYGAPPFDRKGAITRNDPRYRGEVWVAEGEGKATIARWTPSRVVVDVAGAAPGALVVYNMNFDEGWSSDVGPVEAWGNAVAVRLPAGETRVVLRYRPPHLGLGLALFAATVGLFVWLRRRESALSGVPRSAAADPAATAAARPAATEPAASADSRPGAEP